MVGVAGVTAIETGLAQTFGLVTLISADAENEPERAVILV